MPLFSNPHAQALPQKPGLPGIYEQIEMAGRTCYRSDKKVEYIDGQSITAEPFVKKILKSKHLTVAEHGTVYLTIPVQNGISADDMDTVMKYRDNPYSRVRYAEEAYYITTNYRVLYEHNWLDDLKYMVEPTCHVRRYTVRFFTDRGVSAESNRHRRQSVCERSTRFVNYGHDRFISVNRPEELDEQEIITAIQERGGNPEVFRNMCSEVAAGTSSFNVLETWLFANLAAEWSYMRLLELGWSPQQARRVLPMDVETELVVTAFEDDWTEYFEKRYYGTTGKPHPDMEKTCECIMKAFLEAGWRMPVELAWERYNG